MTKTLFLILFLLTLSMSLKHSEIGRNDWHKQNIGQVSHLQLLQNKLFYITEQNILGHLRLDSGQIESRITLGSGETVLGVSEKEVTFLTENNQLVVYRTHNLEKNTNNRFVTDKILKGIKSYVKSVDGKTIFVCDEKNVRSYPAEQNEVSQPQHNDIYTAQPNEIIQRIVFFNENLYIIILNDSNISFKLITDGKVNDNEKTIEWLESENIQNWNVVDFSQIEDSFIIQLKSKVSLKGQTLVFNRSFSLVYFADEAYNQIIGTQLLFDSKIYDVKSKRQAQKLIIFYDSNLNVEYSLVESEDKIEVFKGDLKYTTIAKQSVSQRINRVFYLQKTSVSFIIVIQYNDMTLSAHLIENGVQKNLWKRQEGLSSIEKVLFMKYSFNDHLDNEYHRNLLSPTYLEMSIVQKLMKAPMFIGLRVKQQVSDLLEIVLDSLQSLLDFSKLGKIDLKSLAKFTMSEQQELKLGLKKYIIAVTNHGVLYAIDTKTQQILWKQIIQPIYNRKHYNSKDRQVITLMDLRKDYQLQAAVLISYNDVQKQLILQQINQKGDITLLQIIQSPVLPSIHKLNHESIIITMGDKTIKYRLGQSQAHEKHFYFYTEQKDRIVGWKQTENDVIEIWNFNLDEGERIVSTASAYRNQQSTHIPLFENGKVIFKNVDFTNLAVLTSKNATSMSLYILNGITGQVHFNEYRSGLNLNHPVNLAYDENNVIVTYYNNRNKLYEIWTVEQYQQRIQSSAINMIKDYLEGVDYKPSRNRENIIFLSEVYGSPVSIKKLFISESKESLIRRNLFVITRDDKLYMIGRELVSTRRPKETALFSNQAYPPYQYLLPLDPTKFFSYNLDLHNLRGMEFSASDMQSTIFVMGYGTDIFLIRVAPDQPFDTITEDFNYLVLVAIMAAVTVGVLVLRYKAKKAKLIKPHKD